jgi:hypothetical protein
MIEILTLTQPLLEQHGLCQLFKAKRALAEAA